MKPTYTSKENLCLKLSTDTILNACVHVCAYGTHASWHSEPSQAKTKTKTKTKSGAQLMWLTEQMVTLENDFSV